jgi:hypothetical protein
MRDEPERLISSIIVFLEAFISAPATRFDKLPYNNKRIRAEHSVDGAARVDVDASIG